MAQIVKNDIHALETILEELSCKKALLVCDQSFDHIVFADYIKSFENRFVRFSGFGSNPLIEDAQKGVAVLLNNNCDCIIAVGGGSSLDVAKYIKLEGNHQLPLIAIPTTAGTGSESTQHIVVYENGVKRSIANEIVIPNYVILDATVLETLPPYQKVCTALDAFFQGVESYWSVNSSPSSRKISALCINQMSRYLDVYFSSKEDRRFNVEVAMNIMEAANLSGQAINLTQTTAGHAMSYKLSSMFNIPHGHAVALCMFAIWNYSIDYVKKHKLTDVERTMLEICDCTNFKTLREFSDYMHSIIYTYGGLWNPVSYDFDRDVDLLTASVNPERLKNNPIRFDANDLKKIYSQVLLRKDS